MKIVNIFLIIGLSSALLFSCQKKQTAKVKTHAIEEVVFASGYIEQQSEYMVSATTEGTLLKLPVKEGETLQAGDLMAVVSAEVQFEKWQEAKAVYNDASYNASESAPKLAQIKSQIDQASIQLNNDTKNLERYQRLRVQNSVSQKELEQAELQYKASQNHLEGLQENYQEVAQSLMLNKQRSKAQLNSQKSLLEDYSLMAAEAGQVISLYKKRGELVRKGEAIAKIGSGDYIIKLLISEDDIVQISKGQSVAVQLNTYPDQTFEAEITKVYPGFDAVEQSYLAEARFFVLPERMFSGTQVQANIRSRQKENALVVPTEFVTANHTIFMADGSQRQLRIGSQNSQWTEVLSGVRENELIIKPSED